jgi:tetratricopeptide (TPR) repeat protein
VGRYEEAITTFENAISIKPDYVDAWYKRAGSNVRIGEIEKALSDLEGNRNRW